MPKTSTKIYTTLTDAIQSWLYAQGIDQDPSAAIWRCFAIGITSLGGSDCQRAQETSSVEEWREAGVRVFDRLQDEPRARDRTEDDAP
jgi:hypothetical protein